MFIKRTARTIQIALSTSTLPNTRHTLHNILIFPIMSTLYSDERQPLKKNMANKSACCDDDPASMKKKGGYGVVLYVSVVAILSVVVLLTFLVPGAAVVGDTTTSSLLRTTTSQVISTGTSNDSGGGVSIVIVYAGASDTGSTATLAKWIAEGASRVEGTTVIVKGAKEATPDDLQNADGIILGSGDYNGSPEPAMFDFLDAFGGKLDLVPFGVFATGSGYAQGVQEVLNSMARELMTFGGIYVSSGRFSNSQGVAGLTGRVKKPDERKWIWEGADPTDDSREKGPDSGLMRHLQDDAIQYGKRIATLATTLHSSF